MNLLKMARVWWRLRLGKPVGLSIDITDRCTLSCAGCYMKWYDRNDDLPLERWEEIVQSFPESERTFCAWTGGEPLLRADDVRALSRHFDWSWVATNGTRPIPELPRTTFFVSVDGPEEIHDRLRGGWREIVRNVRADCYIACTVRRANSSPEVLRELVGFWRPRARGIVFGFLTPRRGEAAGGDAFDKRSVAGLSMSKGGESESLGAEERRRVVRTLRELRRESGSFVLGVWGQAPDCAATAWGERCPAKAGLVALDARGERKEPCTLGSQVDCSLCGCAVPGFLRRVRRLHVPTLLEVAGLFRA